MMNSTRRRQATRGTLLLVTLFAAAACGNRGGGSGNNGAIAAFTSSASCTSGGTTVSLAWDVAKAKNCAISPDIGSLDANVGTADVTVNEPTTYTLTCGDGEDAETATVTILTSDGAGVQTLVASVSFERVPSSVSGLDYDTIETLPIRQAVVELLDACTGEVLVDGTTDDEGAITLDYTGPPAAKLRVYAESTNPPVRVVDNTNGQAIYAIETAEFDVSEVDTVTAVAASGWDGSAYTGVRASGPFAILDSSITAGQAFAAITDVTFPLLVLNWSVDNRPEGGSTAAEIADGAIGTSYWSPIDKELFILGQANIDTDEFDEHVIVHEWGHYYESSLSRADTIGGQHGFSDILDARVAFSEGWGNALSAIILDPKSIYIDTFDTQQSVSSGFDVNLNSDLIDPIPGWFSESSVQAILYDLFDRNGDEKEAWDGLDIGLVPIHRVLVGPQVSTDALTTIYTFIDALKKQSDIDDDAVDLLLAKHDIEVYDEWATDEDNYGGVGEEADGGIVENLPLFHELDGVGDQVTMILRGGVFAIGNRAGQNRFARFPGTGGDVTVDLSSSEDVDLFVYHRGTLLAQSVTFSEEESVTLSTDAGKTYVVWVQGWGEDEEKYNATVELK